MYLWNFIQSVSLWASPRLHLNHWHAFTISHQGCELQSTTLAPFESLIWLHEILSSMWVIVYFFGTIWITDMSSSNFIQAVSCCVFPRLYLNLWHVSLKIYLASELLFASWTLFESLICSHKILSSKWVAVHLLDSIWIADMSLLNLIQAVSCCAPPWLYLPH